MRIASRTSGCVDNHPSKDHIDQTATVCGTVVSIDYGGGGRTLVHLDKEWLHDVFTISIRAEDWNRFSPDRVAGKVSKFVSLE